MSNYINRVLDKDQNEYPLRDERLPDAAPEDSGKVPVVNSEGQYELGLPASGTKLYKHELVFDAKKIVFAATYSSHLALYTKHGAIDSAFWFDADASYVNAANDMIIVNAFVSEDSSVNVDGTIYSKLKLATKQSGPSIVLAISGCTTPGDENTRVIVPLTSVIDTVTPL